MLRLCTEEKSSSPRNNHPNPKEGASKKYKESFLPGKLISKTGLEDGRK